MFVRRKRVREKERRNAHYAKSRHENIVCHADLGKCFKVKCSLYNSLQDSASNPRYLQLMKTVIVVFDEATDTDSEDNVQLCPSSREQTVESSGFGHSWSCFFMSSARHGE